MSQDEFSKKIVATNRRIKQSVAYWCFNVEGDQWDLERTCQVAKQLGCPSVEFVDPSDWTTLKQHDLVCSLAFNGIEGAPFVRGWNNTRYHQELDSVTRKSIDECETFGFPNVIAFTGLKWRDAEDPTSGEIGLEEGADNCVKSLQEVAAYAEKKGVTVCLEQLNTRDNSHPMKGHPGYQGDDLDYVAEIVRRVDSPGLKLLFDIYHVQVMHGDIYRRLEENKDILGHVHTAGNPGRCELGSTQEINYPGVMRKLLEIGYEGYVGHEFIPTRDPLECLTEAVKLCDV